MRILAGAATDVGRVRERNEDSFLTQEPLFAVADGMGGHRGGAVASRVALEVLSGMEPEAMSGDGVPEGLAQVVVRANETVLDRAADDRQLKGMGTTLTAVIVEGDTVHLAHVGDSRAYLIRDGGLKRLTEDHTLVQRMVHEGKLTPQEAEIHPHRSVLTRALGVEGDVEVDTASVDVQPGDRLLLCSDGLTTMVPEEDILGIVTGTEDPQAAAEALVDAANAAGGVDNVTALLLFAVDGVGAGGSGSRASTVPGPPATEADPEPARGTAAPAQPDIPVYGPAEPGPPPRRRRGPRILAWLLAVAVLATAAFLGGRAYVRTQWFVGAYEGRVALFQGMPVEVLGYELHEVVEVTALPAAEAMLLRPWRDLDQGITADSEEEARSIIDTIRRDLTPERARGGQGAG